MSCKDGALEALKNADPDEDLIAPEVLRSPPSCVKSGALEISRRYSGSGMIVIFDDGGLDMTNVGNSFAGLPSVYRSSFGAYFLSIVSHKSLGWRRWSN